MRPAVRPARTLPLTAALCVTLALPAFAQGTPEQRTACAPDAVRLCPDTIPDVGRTKACMIAHEAELSPRCHTAFLGAITPRDRVATAPAPETDAPRVAMPVLPAPDTAAPETPPPEPMRRHRIARATPAPAPEPAPFDGFGSFAFTLPHTGDAKTARDARHARVVVGRLCRNAVLDANTCAFTNRMIDLAE